MEENSHWKLALLLGLVQGISEFLPISSSGHLILLSWYLDGKPLPMSLNVALHVGTLLTIAIFFWRDWKNLADKVIARALHGTKSFESDTLFLAIVVSAIPVGLTGVLAKDFIEAVFHRPSFIVGPLMLVGIALWWVDSRSAKSRTLTSLKLKDGVLIGLFQTLALIPGVSRSGITMLAARGLGFNRADSARFSFLIAAPPMLGASLLHAKHIAHSIADPMFYLGILSSCLFGCITVGFLLRFLQAYGFLGFAIYRFVLGLTILYVL